MRFFPTEREGYTPLSQYQQGLDTVIVQLLCLTGNLEAHFCVFHTVCMFSLASVMDYNLLTVIWFMFLFVTYSLKQAERFIDTMYKNYGVFEVG